MGPADLRELLGESAPSPPDPRVLVGTETGDDAGVYALDGESRSAVVSTADFITPPFDDPENYGRIAAANSISDVYAMGGRPICALNLCLFPRELTAEVAKEILAGAQAVLGEAGAALVGGHTVRCAELFFGLSVTGLVDPGRIWRNVGARPGDVLLLTKPLGCGLIVTGARRGLVGDAERRLCAAQMARSNRRAAETLQSFAIHAATDVTGFGLIGHALGMARGVKLELELAALPLYAGAHALAAAGVTCAGARANRAAYRERIQIAGAITAADDELLFDPQTSGGLLLALPAAESDAALVALGEAGVQAARIGSVLAPGGEGDYAVTVAASIGSSLP